MIILKILGSALTLYGVYGMLSGEVYAKQGITSRFIYKSEEPVYEEFPSDIESEGRNLRTPSNPCQTKQNQPHAGAAHDPCCPRPLLFLRGRRCLVSYDTK